jgi:hypothetical protein
LYKHGRPPTRRLAEKEIRIMSIIPGRFIRLAMLLILTAAFAVGVYGDVASRVDEIQRFTAKTDTFDYKFEVSTSEKTARLRVTARISAGEVEWVLRDPNGDVRLQGYNDSGRSQGDTGNLTPEAGTWTLHIDLQNASGEYAVRWESR